MVGTNEMQGGKDESGVNGNAFRVRVAFFQGGQGGLGFTSMWGKMGLKGPMTSYSLKVLLAAILD